MGSLGCGSNLSNWAYPGFCLSICQAAILVAFLLTHSQMEPGNVLLMAPNIQKEKAEWRCGVNQSSMGYLKRSNKKMLF